MKEKNKDLAKDIKDELIEEKKYYQIDELELDKVFLGKDLEPLVEKTKNEKNEQMFNIYIKLPGKIEYIKLATIEPNGILEKNETILQDETLTDNEKKMLGNLLNLLGLEYNKINLSKIEEQLKDIQAKTEEEIKAELEKEQENNVIDEEKEKSVKDETEQKEQSENETNQERTNEDDQKKVEIAELYGVKNTNQIVSINMANEKVTKNDRFKDKVPDLGAYDAAYVIQDGDPYTWKMVGYEKGKNKPSEIKNVNDGQIHGKNPDVKIKLVDNNKITPDVKPLAMYKIDGETAIAIIKREGQLRKTRSIILQKRVWRTGILGNSST